MPQSNTTETFQQTGVGHDVEASTSASPLADVAFSFVAFHIAMDKVVDLVSPFAAEKDSVASLVVAEVSLTPLVVIDASKEGLSPNFTGAVQSGLVTHQSFEDEIEPSRAISKEQAEISISTSEATSRSSVVLENAEP